MAESKSAQLPEVDTIRRYSQELIDELSQPDQSAEQLKEKADRLAALAAALAVHAAVGKYYAHAAFGKYYIDTNRFRVRFLISTTEDKVPQEYEQQKDAATMPTNDEQKWGEWERGELAKQLGLVSSKEMLDAMDESFKKMQDPANRKPEVFTDYGGGAWSVKFSRYDD